MQIIAYDRNLSQRNIERIEMNEDRIARAYEAYKASNPRSRSATGCRQVVILQKGLSLLFGDGMAVIRKVVGLEVYEVGEVRL